jgi:hypothetical protein
MFSRKLQRDQSVALPSFDFRTQSSSVPNVVTNLPDELGERSLGDNELVCHCSRLLIADLAKGFCYTYQHYLEGEGRGWYCQA